MMLKNRIMESFSGIFPHDAAQDASSEGRSSQNLNNNIAKGTFLAGVTISVCWLACKYTPAVFNYLKNLASSNPASRDVATAANAESAPKHVAVDASANTGLSKQDLADLNDAIRKIKNSGRIGINDICLIAYNRKLVLDKEGVIIIKKVINSLCPGDIMSFNDIEDSISLWPEYLEPGDVLKLVAEGEDLTHAFEVDKAKDPKSGKDAERIILLMRRFILKLMAEQLD